MGTADREAPPLARHPWIGLVTSLFGLVVFTIIALNVRQNGPLLAWDEPLAQGLHQRATHDPQLVVQAMRFSSFVGHEFINYLSWALALWWLFKRRWRALSLLATAMLGNYVIYSALTAFFDRQRPSFPDPLDPLPGPGFPSGHVVSALLLYGLIVYLLWPRLRTPLNRAVAVSVVVLLALLIGYSRLYMGNHFLTDVIAGYALALAWGGLDYTVVELVLQRLRHR